MAGNVELHCVLGNTPSFDGGAMFGNAPRALWETWMPPDDLNRVRLACRSLLVRTKGYTVLFEAGIGACMPPKCRERYGVADAEHVLLKSLARLELGHEDITDIVLSHLHFDHAGGLLSAWQEGREPELLFPNAKYYVTDEARQRAASPHYRDKASFIPVLNQKLALSQRLVKLRPGQMLCFDELELHPRQSDGHTPGMLCSDLRWGSNRLVVAADLIPGRAWVHLPITMGYDRYPELLINEKEALLAELAQEDAWLFYTHDPEVAVSKVRLDETRHVFSAVDCREDLRGMAFAFSPE